jgi:hypothetical protein
MVGATVGLGATVVAVGVIGVTDIAAGAARPLDARPVEVSPLTLLLAFILTTSLCPSRGTMMLCARLSKPTARPPTSSVLQSTPPRARSLWSHQQPCPEVHRQYYPLDQLCPLVQARLALERVHRCSSRSTRPARRTRGLPR